MKEKHGELSRILGETLKTEKEKKQISRGENSSRLQTFFGLAFTTKKRLNLAV
jgi:hypothetical protein